MYLKNIYNLNNKMEDYILIYNQHKNINLFNIYYKKLILIEKA